MWPGFKSRHRRHVWVEFVVGSLLCSKRFFSGYSGFPLSSKTNISKFQFDQESGRRRTTMWMYYLEGDIGGYPIPQYRTKTWQIPKYRVENGRNTDTAFMMGDAYSTLYPSRDFFFYLKHVYTRNQPPPSKENVRRSRIDGYKDRKARSLDVLPHHRVTVRNCVFIYC